MLPALCSSFVLEHSRVELIYKFAISNQPDWTHQTDTHKHTERHIYIKPVPHRHTLIQWLLLIHAKYSPNHTDLTWEPVTGLIRPLGQLYSEPGLLAQMDRLEGGWHGRAGHPCCHVKPDCLLCLERASSQGHAVHSQSPAHHKGSPGWKKWEHQALYSALIYCERRQTSCREQAHYSFPCLSEIMGLLLKLSTLKKKLRAARPISSLGQSNLT